MTKTIFITGASRGLGKIWAEAFLQQGYKVAATARNTDSLKDLVQRFGDAILPIQLDVNNRNACFAAVKQANQHFGAIDVLINNAGYGLFGAIEETSEQEARAQIETNVFGLLWVTQAVLPVMRKQASGHIIQVSSALGLVTAPTLGIYNASKFAVEGLSETLATEVKDFGINVTIVEPNGFGTDWGGASAAHAEPMKEYEPLKEAFNAGMTDDIFGIPEATIDAMLQLVKMATPPLRLFLGKVAFPWVKEVYEQRMATWSAWQDLSVAAHGK
jgi:NAD(P)-dependent dehydrogenase (short-subunit alcohol dehydrogenase family)